MLEEGNTLIQVVVGPRQTGKSTMIAQALRGLDVLAHSVSADDILAPTEEWLRDERQQARNLQPVSYTHLATLTVVFGVSIRGNSHLDRVSLPPFPQAR